MAEPEEEKSEVLEVIEERIRVEKREVVSGRVRVSTVTDHVEDMIREELRGTRAEVVRVPIGRTLGSDEAVPGPRTEDNVTIVPVFEEIVVIEKRLVLKEELHITQQTVVENVEVPVTLRQQRAVVERLEPDEIPD